MLYFTYPEYTILISDFQNTIVLKPTGYFGIKLIAGILFIILFVAPSTSIIQDATASQPSAQIISAKADGSNIIRDTLITLTSGKTSSLLSFEFRGFDDTDHIVELQCSFDGINYMKTNCASQSEEGQSSFPGSDGVQRNYNVKSGKAYRQVTPLLFPKTYFFGVKVLNDKNELSPAVTWTFKMRTANDAPLVGEREGTPGLENVKKIKRITVHFDSIRIYDDWDPDSGKQHVCKNGHVTQPNVRCPDLSIPRIIYKVIDPGEWHLWAFVQGKIINLLQRTVTGPGADLQFVGKEITLDIREDVPLSIFTYGIESDFPLSFNTLSQCKVNRDQLTKDVAQIFMLPHSEWNDRIKKLQTELGPFKYFKPCEAGQKLPMINKFFTGEEPVDIRLEGKNPNFDSNYYLDITITTRMIESSAAP